MDLRITIIDENDEILQMLTVYQNGSDSEGAAKIADYIRDNFEIDADIEWANDFEMEDANGTV